MTAFAGIANLDGAPVDIHTQEQLRRAICSTGKARTIARRADGACVVEPVEPASKDTWRGPQTGRPQNRYLFAATARLDNRAELGAALDIPAPELLRAQDGDLVCRALERWGEAGVARCLGAFAFARWDAEARRLTLGRDCLGNRALFFYRGKTSVAFASTLGALLALPQVPREIDERVLANFLAVNLTEPRDTFYRGVERVPSRMLVTIGPGVIDRRHYWSPGFDAAPRYRRDEDYVERARELFDQAVVAATADLSDLAIATSGGLDSSAIAATAARIRRAKSIICYTMVPPAGTQIEVPMKYLDERHKVEALAEIHPALDVRFISPERAHPYEDDVTRFFARARMPILGPTILEQHSHLHEAVAAAGHRTLLVGNYGNFGLTWWGSYSLLSLLATGQWMRLARETGALARQDGVGLPRTVMRELVLPGVPASLQRLIYRIRGRDPDSVARFSALNPVYVAETGLHRQWQECGFDPWFGVDGWDPAGHRARILFDHNQFARDFKAMSADLRGFELRDPHGDRRLLEFLLAVPEPMYRRNGVPRSFARAVLADRLPRAILDERRRGAVGVTWFQRLDARRQSIAAEIDRLHGSPLARRLIDLPRLKRLIDEWPADEHAAERRRDDYRFALARGLHVGRFIRWVEGFNA